MRAEIAKKLRANAEKYGTHSRLFNPWLCGMCAVCSWALAEAFRRHGYTAVAVYGKFDGNAHCWVRSGDEIWDITGTQFGPEFPPVHRTTVDDEIYNEQFPAPVLTHPWWNEWSPHQKPSKEITNLLLKET